MIPTINLQPKGLLYFKDPDSHMSHLVGPILEVELETPQHQTGFYDEGLGPVPYVRSTSEISFTCTISAEDISKFLKRSYPPFVLLRDATLWAKRERPRAAHLMLWSKKKRVRAEYRRRVLRAYLEKEEGET